MFQPQIQKPPDHPDFYSKSSPEKLLFEWEKTLHQLIICPREIKEPRPHLKAAILTGGGVAPGINAVIHSLVQTLNRAEITEIYGIPYGFQGFQEHLLENWIKLTESFTAEQIHKGGSFLAVGRGFFDQERVTRILLKRNIQLFFIIGGDGSLNAAKQLSLFWSKPEKNTPSIIGIPKTIDNDIHWVPKSFGFETAVEVAQKSIQAAQIEAKNAYQGLGVVKIMGRQAGHLAAHAAASIPGLDAVLIPEIPVCLKELYNYLENKLQTQGWATLVVAEGASEGLLKPIKQPSYLHDLPFLAERIKQELPEAFRQKGQEVTLKYIDSSYLQRSQPPNSFDQLFCQLLGQKAVLSALNGLTHCFISFINHQFVALPLDLIDQSPKTLDLEGDIWSLLLQSTQQPLQWKKNPSLKSPVKK